MRALGPPRSGDLRAVRTASLAWGEAGPREHDQLKADRRFTRLGTTQMQNTRLRLDYTLVSETALPSQI